MSANGNQDLEARRVEARNEVVKLRKVIKDVEQQKQTVQLNIEKRRAGGSKKVLAGLVTEIATAKSSLVEWERKVRQIEEAILTKTNLEAKKKEKDRIAAGRKEELEKITEEKRRAEKDAEARRLAEQKKIDKEEAAARKAAEQKKIDDEREAKARKATEQKKLDDEKEAEARRLVEQKKINDEKEAAARKAAEQKKIDDEREAEARRLAEQKKINDDKEAAARKAAEQKKLDDEKEAKARRLAEQQKINDEKEAAARKAAEQKKLDDEREAEARKAAEEKKLDDEKEAEARRLTEQKKISDDKDAGAKLTTIASADTNNSSHAGKSKANSSKKAGSSAGPDGQDTKGKGKRKRTQSVAPAADDSEKKRCTLPPMQRWVEMTAFERQKRQAEGECAVNEFLRAQAAGKKSPHLPVQIRNFIRNVQVFVPCGGTTNRELALECFKLTNGHRMCQYHQARCKRQGAIDGEHDGTQIGEFQVTGVPYKRTVSAKPEPEHELDEHEAAGDPTSMPEGFMDCGCSEEAVLFEFFFWKTWTISSPATGVTEGWSDQVLEPRSRLFVVTAFKAATKLSLDDMYTNGLNARDYRRAILTMQIERFTKELKEMDKPEGDSAEDAIDADILKLARSLAPSTSTGMYQNDV